MYCSQQFSSTNKPRKNELEQTIAGFIKYTTNASRRAEGLSIVSLVGPNLKKHVDNYSSLLGKVGTLHSVERDPCVFESQLRKSKRIKGSYRLHHGNYWDVLNNLLEEHKLRNQAVYIDFDACCQLDTLVKENMNSIRESICLLTHYQKVVWVSITHTLRTRRKFNNDSIVNQFTDAWLESQKWQLSFKFNMPYRDGAPMNTVLMKFEQK